MESMVTFLLGCLQDVDLETVTIADLRRTYLEARGMTKLSKDDNKLFSDAVKTALSSFVAPENKISGIEIELNKKDCSKEEAVMENGDDVTLENDSTDSKIHPDSDEDFSHENINKETVAELTSAKKMNGNKMKIDSSDSDDEPLESVKNTKLRKSPSISAIKKQRLLPNSSDDEDQNGEVSVKNSKIVNKKKKIQKINSDEENSMELGGNVARLARGHKMSHVSSNSDSDDNSVQDGMNNIPRTTILGGKKRRYSNSSSEEKSEKLSSAARDSEENVQSNYSEWSLKYSSDSGEEAHTKLPKKVIDSIDSEGEPLPSLNERKSSNSEDESLKTLANELLINLAEKKSNCSFDSEDEPLTNLANQKIKTSINAKMEIKDKCVTKYIEKNTKDSSDSENKPVINFEKAKSLKLPKKNSSEANGKTFTKLQKKTKKPEFEKNKLKNLINSDSEDKPLKHLLKHKINYCSDSEDETIAMLAKKKLNAVNARKSVKRNLTESGDKLLMVKKTNNFSDSEDDFIIKISDNLKKETVAKPKKIIKKQIYLRKKQQTSLNKQKSLCSSDSENEPLKNLIKRKLNGRSNSENKSIVRLAEKKLNSGESNPTGSNDKLLGKEMIEKTNDFGNSEDEPIIKVMKNNIKKLVDIKSKVETVTKIVKTDKKTIDLKIKIANLVIQESREPSDSEDEPIAMLKTKKKSNYINSKKSVEKKNYFNDSKDEPIIKLVEKNIKLIDSSDLEDEPLKNLAKIKLNRYANLEEYECIDNLPEKKSNSIDSKKSGEKISTVSKDRLLTKVMREKTKDFCDSDDEPIIKLVKKNLKKPETKDKFTKITKGISKEKKDKRFVKSAKKTSKQILLDMNKSKLKPQSRLSKRKIIHFSDSEEEAITKPLKKSKTSVGSKDKLVKKSAEKNTSESEDEPLTNFVKQETPTDSEDEPVAKLSRLKPNKSLDSEDDLPSGPDQKNSESENETLTNFAKQKFNDSSDSEDEPVAKLGKKNSIESDDETPKKETEIKRMDCSDSEDELIINLSKKKTQKFMNDKNKQLKNLTEVKQEISSDSDDELLGELFNKPNRKFEKSGSPTKSEISERSSSPSINENDEQHALKKQKNKQPKKEDPIKKKQPTASESKIDHLKKYVRAAGIRVQSYTKLFENCKSMKAKSEKLMDLLEKEGLKGRPTLEKCKKLKKKIETKKEIAELDLSNILKTEGRRPKRSICSDATNFKKEMEKSPPVKKFARLLDIVDSEGSD